MTAIGTAAQLRQAAGPVNLADMRITAKAWNVTDGAGNTPCALVHNIFWLDDIPDTCTKQQSAMTPWLEALLLVILRQNQLTCTG